MGTKKPGKIFTESTNSPVYCVRGYRSTASNEYGNVWVWCCSNTRPQEAEAGGSPAYSMTMPGRKSKVKQTNNSTEDKWVPFKYSAEFMERQFDQEG